MCSRGEGVLSSASSNRGRLECVLWLFVSIGVRLASPLTFSVRDDRFWFWRKAWRNIWFVESTGGVAVNDEGFDFIWEFDWGK